ncbi:hypothetical protein JYU34_003968 [Plutella xylostella]|uniref:Small EDRK-rich factor-like N-terminal domain-containing protein n=2 Tax=Plutella xylostella TaxID=51655 RepID=A0ABQ7R1B4_PLUXY|nr:hypothetical protein JYU34_003968 [Plutella xylostella]
MSLSFVMDCSFREQCTLRIGRVYTAAKVKLKNNAVVGFSMARGQQKLQSQAKAAEKQSKMKKQQGHSATDQKKAAQKALVHVCSVCKAQMPDPKTYKQHFENKHPKNELPEDLKAV